MNCDYGLRYQMVAEILYIWEEFVEVSKNLAKYKSENNFVESSSHIRYSNWLLECENFLQYRSWMFYSKKLLLDLSS